MNFFERVYELVEKIPERRVATYGLIASAISTVRAARAVGMALNKLPPDTKVPWHRVVNSHGMISIEHSFLSKIEQVHRLQAEGIAVEFKSGNYWVDLEICGWNARFFRQASPRAGIV